LCHHRSFYNYRRDFSGINPKNIVIRGAREHNLKNIHVEIPRDKFIVITGLSGSGKSTLAFDTLYAEGQRRYVESLSTYARQFLEQMQKPEVDHIEGLSPAIAIQQKPLQEPPEHGGTSPRSTITRCLCTDRGPDCTSTGLRSKGQSPERIADGLWAAAGHGHGLAPSPAEERDVPALSGPEQDVCPGPSTG
jgi:excinuclease ABC subunit A